MRRSRRVKRSDINPKLLAQVGETRTFGSGFELVIPGKFPGLNQIMNEKGMRYKGKWNDTKIRWQEAVEGAWKRQGRPAVKGPFCYGLRVICSDKRRDPDNIW